MMEIEFSSPVGHEKRSMHPETHEPLKLVALDEDDLKILSANLQDAVLRMSDMAWVPSEHRFAAILNRFDWLAAVEGEGSHLRRCRCALRFDRVKRAQVQNIKPGEPSAFAELLAVTYEQAQPPSGYITSLRRRGRGPARGGMHRRRALRPWRGLENGYKAPARHRRR